MKKIPLLIFISLMFFSCNKIKNKTKESIKTGGEVVGKGVSEFGKGVKKGIDESFNKQIIISETLKNTEIEIGDVSYYNRYNEEEKDLLSVYLIFNHDIDIQIIAKAKNKENVEIGRSFLSIKAPKDSAAYFDFEFDSRMDLTYDCVVELDKYEKE